MTDPQPPSESLVIELAELRRQITFLTAADLDRRRIEEALRETELQHRKLLEASTDAIFLETLKGDVLSGNVAASRLYGYTEEEFTKLNVADLVPEEVARTLPDVIAEESTTGGVFVEATQKRKDGSLFPAEVSTRLITLNERELVVAFVRDITDRKAAQQALQEARDELEQKVIERTAELESVNQQLRREICERHEAEEGLQKEQRLLRQLLTMHERDRKLIGYEIHDGLAQYLASAQMLFESARQQQVRQASQAGDTFEAAMQLLRRSIAEARRLIGSLRRQSSMSLDLYLPLSIC